MFVTWSRVFSSLMTLLDDDAAAAAASDRLSISMAETATRGCCWPRRGNRGGAWTSLGMCSSGRVSLCPCMCVYVCFSVFGVAVYRH